MKECAHCLHEILSEEDFGSIRNHLECCPVRQSPNPRDVQAFQIGYMDRLGDRWKENETAAYDLGWQHANTYLERKKLEKNFKSL